MSGEVTCVASSVLDGVRLQPRVLTAVGVAPQPQQHSRAAVLQGHFKGPLGLLLLPSRGTRALPSFCNQA